VRKELKQVGWTKGLEYRLFEAAAEQHGGPDIFLLPAIEIAMAITARAGQVLGDRRQQGQRGLPGQDRVDCAS
jgi:hypothetical protein